MQFPLAKSVEEISELREKAGLPRFATQTIDPRNIYQMVSMMKDVVKYGTEKKAKVLKRFIEPLITKTKDDSTHNRRVVFRYLRNKNAVSELFRTISNKIGDNFDLMIDDGLHSPNANLHSLKFFINRLKKPNLTGAFASWGFSAFFHVPFMLLHLYDV